MFEKSKASRYLYLDMIGMKTSTRDKEAYKIYSKDKDRHDELKAKIIQKIKGNAYIGLKTENNLWQHSPSTEDELEKQAKCLEYCKKNKDLLSEVEKDLRIDIHLEFESWFNEQYATGLIPHFTEQGESVAKNKIKYYGEDDYITIMNELLLDKFVTVLDPILTSLPKETVENVLFNIDLDIDQIDTLSEIFRNIKENIPCDERKYKLYYVLGSTLNEEINDIKETEFKKIKSEVIKYLEDAYKLSKVKIEEPGKDDISTEIKDDTLMNNTITPPVISEEVVDPVKNEGIPTANETVDIVPEDEDEDDENLNGPDIIIDDEDEE